MRKKWRREAKGRRRRDAGRWRGRADTRHSDGRRGLTEVRTAARGATCCDRLGQVTGIEGDR